MNWIRNKQQWRDYLLITLGTAVMAVATSSIYDPAGLVTGGFSGLAIVIKQLSQMPVSYTHLDVYKRQDQDQVVKLQSVPFRHAVLKLQASAT